MANATKATKTLVTGTDGMLILEPGVHFSRKTNLPANWKKIRIGIMASFTNLVDANGTPTNETRTANSNIRQVFHLGMSNGVGLPGDAGNKFVGMRACYFSESSYGNSISLDSAVWRMQDRASGGGGAYQMCRNMMATGGVATSGGNYSQYFESGNPVATSGFMFGALWELDITTAGSYILKYQGSSTLSNLSDPGDSALMNLISSTTTLTTSGATITGGWWSGSVPVDCQYLSIRAPFLLNRLRIHNMMVLDLSTY